jgi:hypothetical protein
MDIFDNDSARHVTRTSIRHGANWFIWLAILSVINSLLVYSLQIKNTPFALGVTQWLDGTAGGWTNVGSGIAMTEAALAINIVVALLLAGFGLLARRGSDLAFVLGMFVYLMDGLLVLGLKDFFGFAFHIFALFFLFKGLLASRHVRENAISI